MNTVLITGVSSGIGLGIAKKFLEEGNRVIGSVRNIQDVETLLESYGENFIPIVFDIQRLSEIDNAESLVKKVLGHNNLSAIINNIGFAEIGPLLNVPISILKKHFDILVAGQLYIIQKFYKYLLCNKKTNVGKIINISSISGVGSNKFYGSYAISKHAMEGLSKTLRIELAQYHIKVIVIAPGNIKTPLWEKQTQEIPKYYQNTDVYAELENFRKNTIKSIIQYAMTVDEFVNAFYTCVCKKNPKERYTIVKQRNKLISWIKPIKILNG